MKKLGNYVTGRWIEGESDLLTISDAVTGAPLYLAGTSGLDFRRLLNTHAAKEIRH